MEVALADALRCLLPSAAQTLFLQACLCRGDAVAAAWREWTHAVEDPLRFLAEEGRELRGHLPLLYVNLVERGVHVPPDLGPYLRSAVLRGKLRREKYEACLADTLYALNQTGVDVTLLKGSALGAATAGELLSRHCHDIDAWLPAADIARAVSALATQGYAVRWTRDGSTGIDHPMGLPVALHTHLLPPLYPLPVEEIRRRRREHRAPVGSFRVLSLPDMLAHVCGHASTVRRRPHANWIVDAMRVVWVMTEPDWATFLDLVERSGIALPALVMLGFLRDSFAAPIPTPVIDALVLSARQTGRVQRMAAIEGARLGDPGGLTPLLKHGGWRSRSTVVTYLAFPPACYLRFSHRDMARPRLLAEYVARPARFALRACGFCAATAGRRGRSDAVSMAAETIRPHIRGRSADAR